MHLSKDIRQTIQSWELDGHSLYAGRSTEQSLEVEITSYICEKKKGRKREEKKLFYLMPMPNAKAWMES